MAELNWAGRLLEPACVRGLHSVRKLLTFSNTALEKAPADPGLPVCMLMTRPDSILGMAIHKILIEEECLRVVLLRPSSEAALAAAVCRHAARVVVLTSEMRIRPARLLQRLGPCSQLRIIVVSEEDNLAYVYDQERVLLTQAMDFRQLVGKIAAGSG